MVLMKSVINDSICEFL